MQTSKTIELKTRDKYTKEQITSLTGLSIHTLNGWLKKYPAKAEDFSLVAGSNQKQYSLDYLKSILPQDIREKLLNTRINEQKLIRQATSDSDYRVQIQVVIESKNEVISELKSQNKTLSYQVQELRGRFQGLIKQKDDQVNEALKVAKNAQDLENEILESLREEEAEKEELNVKIHSLEDQIRKLEGEKVRLERENQRLEKIARVPKWFEFWRFKRYELEIKKEEQRKEEEKAKVA